MDPNFLLEESENIEQLSELNTCKPRKHRTIIRIKYL